MLKKPSLPATSDIVIRKELEYLYNRRSAVESLIRSLEQYDQYRPKPAEDLRKAKTA